MRRCEGALRKTDGTFEQCNGVARRTKDLCWECEKVGNKRMVDLVVCKYCGVADYQQAKCDGCDEMFPHAELILRDGLDPVRRAAHKRRTSSRTLQGTVSALKL
jgi:hypothetical protein